MATFSETGTVSNGPPHPWEGPRWCAGSTRVGLPCSNRELGDLGWCLHHVPDDLLEMAEQIRDARRCRIRNGCRQYAVEGTKPPACKNHGANIGSVRYRQATMRVIEDQIAARYAEILMGVEIAARADSRAGLAALDEG